MGGKGQRHACKKLHILLPHLSAPLLGTAAPPSLCHLLHLPQPLPLPLPLLPLTLLLLLPLLLLPLLPPPPAAAAARARSPWDAQGS